MSAVARQWCRASKPGKCASFGDPTPPAKTNPTDIWQQGFEQPCFDAHLHSHARTGLTSNRPTLRWRQGSIHITEQCAHSRAAPAPAAGLTCANRTHGKKHPSGQIGGEHRPAAEHREALCESDWALHTESPYYGVDIRGLRVQRQWHCSPLGVCTSPSPCISWSAGACRQPQRSDAFEPSHSFESKGWRPAGGKLTPEATCRAERQGSCHGDAPGGSNRRQTHTSAPGHARGNHTGVAVAISGVSGEVSTCVGAHTTIARADSRLPTRPDPIRSTGPHSRLAAAQLTARRRLYK